MKKQILLFMALCLMFSVNATTWTVINTTAVTSDATPFEEGLYSGSLKYCVTNAVDGDVVNFDASLTDATILFNATLTIGVQLTIDAASLAQPVKMDGQATVALLSYTPDINTGIKVLTLKGITFQNAKSTSSTVGGVLTVNNNYVIESCKFLNNQNTIATDAASAACIFNNRKTTTFEIRDCTFNGNKGGYRGAVIHTASQSGIFERCYFTANEAVLGSVLYTKAAANTVNDYIEFRNCTMVANKSKTAAEGSVIAMAQNTSAGGYLKLINCTVYGNILTTLSNSKAAIWSAFRKIEFGGCLLGKNNTTGSTSADIVTANVAGSEEIISVGYNTYHRINSRAVQVTTPATNDIIYSNASWDSAPLASAVNAQGVMIPVQTDATLYNEKIRRIPLATIQSWHTASAVDQLGAARNTALNAVGAFQYYSNTLTFANATITKTYGAGPFTEAATGNSAGSIVYSSGTPSVATVNAETGQVTILTLGSTEITATQVESGDFAAGTASYTLNVDNTTGIELKKLNNNVFVNGEDLIVKDAKGSTLRVYTVTGVMVSNTIVDADIYIKNISLLNKGTYIVQLVNRIQGINTSFKFIR